MKRNVPVWIVVFLFLINIIAITKIISLRKDVNAAVKTFEPIRYDNHSLLRFDSLQFLVNGSYMKDLYMTTQTDNQISLDSLLKYKDKILILRIKENTCLNCNVNLINFWNDFVKTKNNENLIVLLDYKNPNDFKIFCNSNQIKGRLYNLNTSKIDNLLESTNYPYMFILTSNKQILNPFLIDKISIDRLANYFSTIRQMF